MVGAGVVLDVVQHWRVFDVVDELFILVPSLLGLKGMRYVSLGHICLDTEWRRTQNGWMENSRKSITWSLVSDFLCPIREIGIESLC